MTEQKEQQNQKENNTKETKNNELQEVYNKTETYKKGNTRVNKTSIGQVVPGEVTSYEEFEPHVIKTFDDTKNHFLEYAKTLTPNQFERIKQFGVQVEFEVGNPDKDPLKQEEYTNNSNNINNSSDPLKGITVSDFIRAMKEVIDNNPDKCNCPDCQRASAYLDEKLRRE